MSPLIVVVTLTPSEETREQLLEVCNRHWPGVQREDGCEKFALHAGPETFVVVERWSSRALWEQHLATADNAALNAELGPLLARPADIWDVTPVPIGDPAKSTL